MDQIFGNTHDPIIYNFGMGGKKLQSINMF